MPTQNFNDTIDPEGRRIAALPMTELLALSERCEAYVAECERRGRQATPEKAEMCEAVYYHIERMTAADSASNTIAAAFTEFSDLRRQLIARGYVTPPIIGTPTAAAIREVCAVLRDALRADEPLPGEVGAMTQRIRDESRQAISAAIDAINAGREEHRPF